MENVACSVELRRHIQRGPFILISKSPSATSKFNYQKKGRQAVRQLCSIAHSILSIFLYFFFQECLRIFKFCGDCSYKYSKQLLWSSWVTAFSPRWLPRFNGNFLISYTLLLAQSSALWAWIWALVYFRHLQNPRTVLTGQLKILGLTTLDLGRVREKPLAQHFKSNIPMEFPLRPGKHLENLFVKFMETIFK